MITPDRKCDTSTVTFIGETAVDALRKTADWLEQEHREHDEDIDPISVRYDLTDCIWRASVTIQ